MRIEAFSQGKNLDDPEANEDQFLVLPGRGYAVIDGVTDRTGHRYNGRLAGYIASRAVQQAVSRFLLDHETVEPDPLIDALSAAIRAAYERNDALEIARGDRARRFGATLALAAHQGDTMRFVLIGDSGLRLNGSEVWINDTGLDLVTTSLRQEAYRLVAEAGGSTADKVRIGRACVWHGAARLHPDMKPWISEATLGTLYARALERAAARFPMVPVADIRRLLDGGVMTGQTQFQNNTNSPLSYAVLDGFEVERSLVRIIDRPLASIRTLELFSDGYFKPGATPDVASWEAAFEEVERDDPEKIDRYPSVKGTVGRIRADDRTVVSVRF